MKFLCQLIQKLEPKQTDRQTNRETDRHTHIHTHTTKTLPLPHTREVIILINCGSRFDFIFYCFKRNLCSDTDFRDLKHDRRFLGFSHFIWCCQLRYIKSWYETTQRHCIRNKQGLLQRLTAPHLHYGTININVSFDFTS